MLFYAIESLVEAGIREIGIIVGDTYAEIRDGGAKAQAAGAMTSHISFIRQDAPLGLAHAVKPRNRFWETIVS